MSTHNKGFNDGEAILMSTNNKGFNDGEAILMSSNNIFIKTYVVVLIRIASAK